MNTFSRLSLANLSTSDPIFEEPALAVLKIKDHSVICGHRNERDQTAAYRSGASQLQWPYGNHNKLPSFAIDVRTYPLPPSVKFGTDVTSMSENELRLEVIKLRSRIQQQPLREEQCYLLGLYVGIASGKGIELRTGVDWNRDGNIFDTNFDDFFHIELVE